MAKKCGAKIRPMPNPTELECELDAKHINQDTRHKATLRDYAYTGSVSTVSWDEVDRRNFRGEWVPCGFPCTLPKDHHGRHAT